jgi:endoglucanase
VYNKYADLDSRCRYIKAVRKALKRLDIPGMLWDYNSSFLLFNGRPAIENLPLCMKDAISGAQ